MRNAYRPTREDKVMRLSTDHILTTHAGSLPRPDDVAQMLYAIIDGKPVDHAALDERVRAAIAEVVARQHKIGIDVSSDGELGKVGFSNYVIQRMSGFEGKADFMAADFADAPGVAKDAFGSEGAQHLRLPILNGPIEMRDTKAVDKEINDLIRSRQHFARQRVCTGRYTGTGHVQFSE